MDKERLLTRRKFLGMLAAAIAAPVAKKVLQIPGLRVLAEASDQVEINKQPGIEFSITTGEPGAKFLAGITAGNSKGNLRVATLPSMEVVAFERSSSVDDPSELFGLSFARKYNVFLPSIER